MSERAVIVLELMLPDSDEVYAIVERHVRALTAQLGDADGLLPDGTALYMGIRDVADTVIAAVSSPPAGDNPGADQ